jgi:hypothetical protein
MSDWMSGAVKHPGALRRKTQAAGESTKEFTRERAHDSGATGEESRLAETFAKYRPKRKKKPARKPNLDAFYGE